MGSFILHRNAYLDGDIQTAESQLFKVRSRSATGLSISIKFLIKFFKISSFEKMRLVLNL